MPSILIIGSRVRNLEEGAQLSFLGECPEVAIEVVKIMEKEDASSSEWELAINQRGKEGRWFSRTEVKQREP